jgi:O-antigen/teichoic acid export membrane protein
MSAFNSSLYVAIAKSMLGRYSVYAAGLISMMILARLFAPQEFGTVAAIAVFYVFFQLISEAGLGPAIINLDHLAPADRNGLFGLTLTVGVVFSILFAALGPVISNFYTIQHVEVVVPYIAVSLLFFAASIVPNALLLRQQAFFLIAKAGLVSEIVSTTATIALHYYIDPLHALASKTSVSAATYFLLTWYFSNSTEFGRPAPGAKFSAIGPLLNFSAYQFGFNFINFFSRNLDNILVGKFFGAVTLGFYDKAYQLMKYPLMLLTFSMTPAIQPVIRKFANDRQKVEGVHRDFTFKISILGACAGLAMFICADWIILVALGSQWMDVVPIIEILAISIPVQVVLSTSGSFFQAMNRADLLFACGCITAVVTVTAIIAGVLARDVEVLCWYLVLAFHLNFLVNYYLMYKKIFFAPLYRHLVRMLPAGAVVIGMILYTHRLRFFIV